MIDCKIHYKNFPYHLWQVLAGFSLLHKSRLINLSFVQTQEKLPHLMFRATINNAEVIFDLNDGYDEFNEAQLDFVDCYNKLLNSCQFLFKRSFDPEINKLFSEWEKVKPLCLYYKTTLAGCETHRYNSALDFKSNMVKLLRRIPLKNNEKSFASLDFRNFEQPPKLNNNPKILFLARMWEPNIIHANPEMQYHADIKNEERHIINEMRAELIIKCRLEFGDNFIGGVSSSQYSEKKYKNIVADNNLTNKFNYMKLVKESDICVANMGLHRSNGGKLPEYVAASKAIISEKLHYQAPGDFINGKNYLEYQTVDECLENINYLVDNPHERYQMMLNNFKYYHDYLRPDRIVLNVLHTVLNQSKF